MNVQRRDFVALVSMFLPWPLKKLAYRCFLGYEVSDSAYVGFSFISAEAVRLESGARVGHLNVVRGLTELSIGSNASIGNWELAWRLPYIR